MAYKISGTVNDSCRLKLFQGNKYMGYTYLVPGAYEAVFESDVSTTVQAVAENFQGSIVGFSNITPIATGDSVTISLPNTPLNNPVHPILGGAVTCEGSGEAITHVTGGLLADANLFQTGAQINSFLSVACTDIADPDGSGGWNTIWDLSDDFPRWIQFLGSGYTNIAYGLSIRVHSGESAGDAVRMKLTMDGNVLFDSYAIRNAAIQSFQGIPGKMIGTGNGSAYGINWVSDLFYIESSIELLIARKGIFDNSASRMTIPAVMSTVYDY